MGYGTEKKLSLTGAVDQVTAEKIAGRPATNVLYALQGESPNLIIQRPSYAPGAGVNLNIRGLGTFGDNNPLAVRLKNLNVGYAFGLNILKKAGFRNVRASFIAQNIWTYSKLNWVDPETTEFANNVQLGASSNSARGYPLPITSMTLNPACGTTLSSRCLICHATK